MNSFKKKKKKKKEMKASLIFYRIMNPVIEQFDYRDLSYENLKTGEGKLSYENFSLVIPIYIDNE